MRWGELHGKKFRNIPKGLRTYREKVKAANELWRALIYRKEPEGVCPVCGGCKGFQAMHVFPKKRHPHLRFDIDNGIPGCQGCHFQLTNDHEKHRDFCIDYLGPDKYEALRLRSIGRGKMDIDLVLLDLVRRTADSDRRKHA